MGAPMRNQAHRLGLLHASLAEQPYAHDYYAVLRKLEAFSPDSARLGLSLRPVEDQIRLGQEPSMTFAPSAISSFSLAAEQTRAKLRVRFFGYLGPHGPMPLHLTEFAIQRERHHGDRTFGAFLDLFHHRWLSLFYRIWAQASPTASLDRPKVDRFSLYVGSLAGYGMAEVRNRQRIPEIAKQFFAGILSRNVRNADGLAAILTHYFRVPARVEPFQGHWLELQDEDRTRIGERRDAARLGRGATLGKFVWDRQHKVRIVLGPMPLTTYQDLLPSGSAGPRLRDWLLSYFGHEMKCDIQLVLQENEVPPASPGSFGALGWSSWLGKRSVGSDAADLVFDSMQAAPAA